MRSDSKTRRDLLVFIALFVMLVQFVSSAPVVAQADVELDKVSLQLTWYHEFQFAGYYAAQLKGFNAEEGLAVEIRDRRFNQLPVDAVLSGQADFGIAASDIVLLRMQGKPVVALACIMQHSPWCLLVRADSDIHTPDDLIGKTVSLGLNYRDVEILAMLKNERLSTDSMTIVEKEPSVETLIKATVDARASYLSNEPFLLREKGFEPRVIRPINYGIDFYGDTLFTSERQIREHPERVAAFRRASLRGWRYAMEQPEELVDYILSAYYSDLKPGEVSYSREHLRFEADVMANDLMHPVLVEIGHMNPHRWRRIADTYAAMGMAEPIESLDDFFYNPARTPNYRWLYVTLGLLAGVGVVGVLAILWNKHLHRAVAQRTRQLRESHQKHERLVDNLHETFLYRHDVKGVFSYVSSSVTQVLGYSTEEFLTHFSEYLTDHPVNQEAVKHTEQSLKGIPQPPYELQIYDKDGRVHWLSVSESPVRESNKQVVAVEGIAHDISNRKRAEEERENLVKTLEFKNKELQDVVYTASHDLRSPLVNIEGFSVILKESCKQLGFVLEEESELVQRQKVEPLIREDIPESLDYIIGSARKMSSLLDGLLQISRIGTAEINISSLDVNTCINEVLQAAEYKLTEHEIAVRASTLPGCKGDIRMLDHIFSNLISNAVKYHDPAKDNRYLAISGRVEGDTSIYCVEDNGIGIASAHQQKVFEIFHRLDPKGTVGGEGLGLTIVTRILGRLEGRIWLESEPGKGSRFYVALPAAKPE